MSEEKWTFWVRNRDTRATNAYHPPGAWATYAHAAILRKHAAILRKQADGVWRGDYEVGPVQRITDPDPFATPGPAPAILPAPPPGDPCPLTWCDKAAHSHTANERDRCAHYLVERAGLVGVCDAYIRDLRTPKHLGEPHGDGLSWRRHAEQRRNDALAVLERRFRALTWTKTGGE